jgi:peptide/nickel transport system permease protein
MLRYIMKRLLMMIPVLLGVSFIVFSMIYFTPGDPAEYMLGMDATPESVASLRAELGLDKPFLVQYFNYIKNIVVHGDFGTSYTTRRSVTTEIVERLPATVTLAVLSIGLATIIGIITGIIAATRQYSVFDHIATIFALTGVSMPNFWTGLMLIIVFSVYLGWFPSSGFSRPIQWVLPAVTVGLASTANIMRQTRSSMLEVIRQDYINTARAKGQKESKVIFKHALRNALIPVITVIGISFGGMLGGAILAESIFSIPGIGKLMIDSINVKNYPMVQGGVLFIAFGFSVVNLLVDILYAFIDPRIKSQYKRTRKSSVVSLAKSKA